MKIPHTLLFLLTIFGSIFVSSVANPLCNGTLLLTSFSGSSNGNYQAFDKTTSPALLTKIANEESLTFSFWWQYFQPTDANTFTLFRLDQSAGGTKSNDHWRMLFIKGCPVGCLTCSSTTVCTSCLDGYNFINDTCVAGCPTNHVEVDAVCYCSNYKTTHCQQCPDNLNTCTECMSGFLLRPNGTCSTACPDEYFGSKKKCISASVRITPVLKAIIDAAGEILHWLLAETVTLLMMMFINY